MKGTPYHRHIARLIMRGEMTVHWDANLPAGRGGEWHPATPTAIYLNPRSVRRHPSGALEAASLVVHEATHAMGGGEPAAFLAQGGFIAHWWFGKGVRTTSFGSQRVQYSINQTFANITRAYGFANRSGSPWALKVMLKQTGYHPNGTFFMPHSNLNPLHMAVFNAGGWGTALNLHPKLDAQLNHWARGYRGNY